MKRNQLRLTSLLLTIVMIICAFPVTAVATDDKSPIVSDTAQAPDDQIYTDTLGFDNPDIPRPVTEMEARREENVKHFLLPDGTIEAVVYSNAVHRKNASGEWEDIDNTLSEDNAKAPDLYVTNDLRVAFAKTFSAGGQLFALNENGYGISMKLMTDQISTSPMLPITEVSSASTSAAVSTVTVTNAATRGNKKQWDTMDEAIAVNNASSIIYSNVRSNTDLEYILDGNNVKENIIIKAPNSSYVYSFELELSELTPIFNDDGSISLSDSETGETQYTIPAPYMYDANGEVSYEVYYTLTKKSNDIYTLKIIADSEWINAKERAFPVTIDPIIEQSSSVLDTYINSGSPSSNYGSSSQLVLSTTKIPFIKLNGLPTLPNGSTVLGGRLRVAYYYYSNVTSGSITAGAYQVLKSWSPTGLTWNSANQYSNLGISTTRLGTASMSGGSAYEATPKWATLYIHDAMVSWYNNSSTNYGIAIKYESGTNGSVILKSYESGSVYRPYFMIHYTEPRLADGVYKIKNKNSNTYLDVTDGATSAGASIQQWSGGATDSNRNQLFKITYLTTYNSYNFYSIRPMTNCGLALYAPTTNITYASIEEAPLTDSYYALDSEFHWQIMENSESGTYFIKNGLSSSTNYLTNGGNNANGTRIYTSASKNHSSMWIFEPYTTAIDGVSFETFSEHLVVGETFTYKAVMFSSTIGRNGPPTYVVYNTDGSSTDKATINATTGELTALKTGTIKVVATYPGVAVGWPILVNIKKGMAGTYFIGNAKYGNFMQIENTSASIDGASLRLTNLENVNTAIWNIEYVGDDYYKIISYVSGKAVTAPSHSGGYITQTDYIGDYTQQWRFAILDGMYIMVPRSNVNYYIAAGEHINNITDVIFSGSNSDKRHQWYLYDVGSEIMLMGIKDARAPHDHVSCFSDVVTNFGMTYDYNIIHTDYISSSACLTQMQNAEIFISRSHGGYDIGYSYLQLYDNETDGLSESRLYSYQIYDSSTSTALVDFSNADVMIFVGCTTAYEGENANNLITAAINAGANCAIGFERNISCETANIWTSLFCQYYNNGYSAYDAAHRAINEIQKDFSAEGINNGLDVGSCKVMYKQ